jgi:hypothetical protein
VVKEKVTSSAGGDCSSIMIAGETSLISTSPRRTASGTVCTSSCAGKEATRGEGLSSLCGRATALNVLG